MRSIIIFLISLISMEGLAGVDLSGFDLKPEQIKIIRKLEAKGKYSEAVLIKLAIASEKHNHKEVEYVPEHTMEELELVQEWALGGVFQKFAKQIAVSFDGHSYMQDYPVYKNGKPFMAIFNFGMATGSEHFSIDILLPAINLERDLNYQLETNPDSFVQYYTEQAIKYGFHIYMKGLKLMI